VKESISHKITFGSDELFDFDKAVLKAPAKAKLDALAAEMQGADITAIHVIGYTDSVGTDAYNEKLSLRRADAVRDYLVSKGVNASVIDAEGKGKRDPVADNKTKEGRSQNRRVDVQVEGSKTVVQ
jgi:OOP family OmpA-OmpF porin